jgi:hypothetical protein
MKKKSMKKPVPAVGDEVRILFHDHVEGTDDVEPYYVYGRVAKVSPRAYTIDSWAMADMNRDREADRENITTFTILRKVIDEVIIFKAPPR